MILWKWRSVDDLATFLTQTRCNARFVFGCFVFFRSVRFWRYPDVSTLPRRHSAKKGKKKKNNGVRSGNHILGHGASDLLRTDTLWSPPKIQKKIKQYLNIDVVGNQVSNRWWCVNQIWKESTKPGNVPVTQVFYLEERSNRSAFFSPVDRYEIGDGQWKHLLWGHI